MTTPQQPHFKLEKIEYVARQDLSETFADSMTTIFFDGQTLRIELCVTRLDPKQPASAAQAFRVPVCRLALPPAAAIELFGRLQQTMAALVQQGVLKTTPPPAPTSEKAAELK